MTRACRSPDSAKIQTASGPVEAPPIRPRLLINDNTLHHSPSSARLLSKITEEFAENSTRSCLGNGQIIVRLCYVCSPV
jgi:hypothetical protein